MQIDIVAQQSPTDRPPAVGVGDRDQALRWLEQGFQDRSVDIMTIRADPLLKPLRGNPCFEALAEKIVPARELAKAATTSN